MTRTITLAAISVLAFGASAYAGADFALVDADADGFVSESEFVSWKTSSGEMSAADALIKFIEIDTDASGLISEAEMDAATSGKMEDDASDSDTKM